MDAAQSEFLALLLEESLSSQLLADLTGAEPGMVTWQSHDLVTKQQQSVPAEGGAVVGCERERVEPPKELTSSQPNPLSFLNTDILNTSTSVEIGTGLFDSMLDSFLGSSTEEVGTGTESTTNFSSLPLVTTCEVTNVGGADGADICFDAETDLDKLLYPFAESILNPAGGDFDTWDVESMLTAS